MHAHDDVEIHSGGGRLSLPGRGSSLLSCIIVVGRRCLSLEKYWKVGVVDTDSKIDNKVSRFVSSFPTHTRIYLYLGRTYLKNEHLSLHCSELVWSGKLIAERHQEREKGTGSLHLQDLADVGRKKSCFFMDISACFLNQISVPQKYLLFQIPSYNRKPRWTISYPNHYNILNPNSFDPSS